MIVIVGAGISGLTLAWALQKAGKQYILLDEGSVAGGKIQTVQSAGFLMDTGPNTLLADSGITSFLHQLGLQNEVVAPNPVSKSRFIFRNGRFHRVAPHPLLLAATGLLSWKSKINIWKERNVAPQTITNETFASFFRRRFDGELLDWAASPVAYGIHAADPEKLLLADAFPTLAALEREHGSLLRGLMKMKGGSRQQSVNFKAGMRTLPLAIATQLHHFEPNTKVVQVEKADREWRVVASRAGQIVEWKADTLVLCTPAFEAARLLRAFSEVSRALSSIVYNPMAVVHQSFSEESTPFQFQGFGGLIPPAAGLLAAGSIWSSSVFSGRAPLGQRLITAFCGGALRPQVAAMPDDEIGECLATENSRLYKIKSIENQRITRWPEAIPQYDIVWKTALQTIGNSTPEGIHFLANWKGGVALSSCITNAFALAGRL